MKIIFYFKLGIYHKISGAPFYKKKKKKKAVQLEYFFCSYNMKLVINPINLLTSQK